MLYLLPNLLSLGTENLFPVLLPQIVSSLDGLIAESDREAIRYFKRFPTKKRFNEMPYALLNEHTKEEDLDFLLEPLVKGETWGLISDAGLPAIADPGANLVKHARKNNIPIKAIPGPSSIFMSIMLSGLPSQRFSFHGYPPRKDFEMWLKKIEKKSQEEKSLELFIEAPYKNQATFDTLLKTLRPQTTLSISQDLTGPNEWTKTAKISAWKERVFTKDPALFLVAT